MSRPTPDHRQTRGTTPDTAADAVDRARLALDGNLLGPALDHVRHALSLDPQHAEARLLEARIRLRRHEPRLALTALNQRPDDHADLDPEARPESVMLRAAALADADQTGPALDLLTALAEAHPDDAGVLRALAGLHVHAGHTDDAIDTLSRLQRLDPDDRGVARTLSDLLADRDPAAALDALGPIDAASRRRAARLYRRAERLAEAEAHYAELLETHAHDPQSDPTLHDEAGAVAEAMGENHRALDRLTPAAADPATDDADAAALWCRVGRLHLHAGRDAAAGRAFFRAARRRPDSPDAWAGLATAAHAADRPRLRDRADHRLQQLTDRADRRRRLAELVPHAHGAPGRDEPEAADHSPLQRLLRESEAVLRLTTQRHPGRADAHYHHAVCALARGEADTAGESLTAALTLNPHYAAAAQAQTTLGPPDANGLIPLPAA
ncbi:MAG: tetratricopeptide repeat protein [Planctomycetota bacterium]